NRMGDFMHRFVWKKEGAADKYAAAARTGRSTMTASDTSDGGRFAGPGTLLLGILFVLTVVGALQDTRYALIEKRKTVELWSWIAASIASVVILRSGRWRGAGWSHGQLSLGTLSNSFYEPRRRWLIDGGAVLGGVAGGLWWGASTWAVLWRGMLRGTANRGVL